MNEHFLLVQYQNLCKVMAALSLNQNWSECLLGTELPEGPGQWVH